MTLLLHQSLKDLRVLRSLLAAWLAVLLLRSVLLAYPFDVAFATLAGDQRSTGLGWQALTLFSGYLLLSLAYAALVVVLAVQLVQSDSPTRHEAFWITRPISRAAMLSSKLLTAALVLVGVPVLADLTVLAVNGVPASDIATAAWQGLVEHSALVVPPMALAAITLDLGGFALASLGLFTGGFVTLLLFLEVLPARAPTLNLSALLAGIPLAVAFGLMVLAMQFVRRSRRRSVAVVVLGVLAFGLNARLWSVDVVARAAGAQAPARMPAPIPATEGSAGDVAGQRVRVVRASCGVEFCEVILRESRAEFAIDWRPAGGVTYELAAPGSPAALKARPGDSVRKIEYFPTAVHMALTWRWLKFDQPDRLPLDAQMLARSRLIPVVTDPAGRRPR